MSYNEFVPASTSEANQRQYPQSYAGGSSNGSKSDAHSVAVPPDNAQQRQSTPTGSGSTNHSSKVSNDWAKELTQLAKTAELRKHGLVLQLHVAKILSNQSTLDMKMRAIQDITEQQNKLDSERRKLLQSLRDVNEDREKADVVESTILRECAELRAKIKSLSENEFSAVKADVDRLRRELGQPALPGLQRILEDQNMQYLQQRRLEAAASIAAGPTAAAGKRVRRTTKGNSAKDGSAGGGSDDGGGGGEDDEEEGEDYDAADDSEDEDYESSRRKRSRRG